MNQCKILFRLNNALYRILFSSIKDYFWQGLTSSDICDPLCSVDEMSSLDYESNYKPKTDLLKFIAISAGVLAGAAIINHSWVAENQVPDCILHWFSTHSFLQNSDPFFLMQDLAMIIVFILGYAGVIFEESLAFNKSGVGLLMAVTLWVIRSVGVLSVTFSYFYVLYDMIGTMSEECFLIKKTLKISQRLHYVHMELTWPMREEFNTWFTCAGNES
jgi:hypothetical protein